MEYIDAVDLLGHIYSDRADLSMMDELIREIERKRDAYIARHYDPNYKARKHSPDCGTKYRGCAPDCTFHDNE